MEKQKSGNRWPMMSAGVPAFHLNHISHYLHLDKYFALEIDEDIPFDHDVMQMGGTV